MKSKITKPNTVVRYFYILKNGNLVIAFSDYNFKPELLHIGKRIRIKQGWLSVSGIIIGINLRSVTIQPVSKSLTEV